MALGPSPPHGVCIPGHGTETAAPRVPCGHGAEEGRCRMPDAAHLRVCATVDGGRGSEASPHAPGAAWPLAVRLPGQPKERDACCLGGQSWIDDGALDSRPVQLR